MDVTDRYEMEGKTRRLVNEYIKCLMTAVRAGTYQGGDTSALLKNDKGEPIEFLDALDAYNKMIDIINHEGPALYKKTNAKIAEYAKEFNVDATRLDAYKFFYWFCETCMERFSTGIEAKLARLVMSRGMNEMLHLDIGKRLAQVMTKKIDTAISGDRLRDVFGKYGLYKVFKNCSLVCRTVCRSFDPNRYTDPLFQSTP